MGIANFIDQVLAAADMAAESSEMDGVARYIEKHLLCGKGKAYGLWKRLSAGRARGGIAVLAHRGL